jgi:hypothetical protein
MIISHFCFSGEPKIENEKMSEAYQDMQFSEKCLYYFSIETLMTSDSSDPIAFLNCFHLQIL